MSDEKRQITGGVVQGFRYIDFESTMKDASAPGPINLGPAPPELIDVDRSVIEEALEQIEANERGENDSRCGTCNANLDRGEAHRPDCRFVRVRDALKAALSR